MVDTWSPWHLVSRANSFSQCVIVYRPKTRLMAAIIAFKHNTASYPSSVLPPNSFKVLTLNVLSLRPKEVGNGGAHRASDMGGIERHVEHL